MTAPRPVSPVPPIPPRRAPGRPGRVRRAARARATCVVAFALVGGCAGGSGAEETTGPAAPTPTPAATSGIPTPTPERRNDADGDPVFDPPGETVPGTDLDGAQRAATAYLDEYFRGLQTGDATYLREHSEQGCEYCALRVEDIENMADSGHSVTSDFVWDSRDFLVIPPDSELGLHGVLFDFSTTEYRVVDGSGATVEVTASEKGALLIGVRKVADGWRVATGDAPNPTMEQAIREQWTQEE